MDEDRHCWCCRSAGREATERELRSIIHSGPFLFYYYYHRTGFLDSIHCWLMSATPFRHTDAHTRHTGNGQLLPLRTHSVEEISKKKTTSTAKRQSRSATPRLLYIFLTDGLDPITSDIMGPTRNVLRLERSSRLKQIGNPTNEISLVHDIQLYSD